MSYREEQPRIGFDKTAERLSSLIPKQGPQVMDDLAKLWDDDVQVEYAPTKSSRSYRAPTTNPRSQLSSTANTSAPQPTASHVPAKQSYDNVSGSSSDAERRNVYRNQEEDRSSASHEAPLRNEKEATFQKVIMMLATMQEENRQLKERLHTSTTAYEPYPPPRYVRPTPVGRLPNVDTGYTVTGPPQDWSTPVVHDSGIARRSQPQATMSFGGMQSISSAGFNGANTNRMSDTAAKLRKLL